MEHVQCLVPKQVWEKVCFAKCCKYARQWGRLGAGMQKEIMMPVRRTSYQMCPPCLGQSSLNCTINLNTRSTVDIYVSTHPHSTSSRLRHLIGYQRWSRLSSCPDVILVILQPILPRLCVWPIWGRQDNYWCLAISVKTYPFAFRDRTFQDCSL